MVAIAHGTDEAAPRAGFAVGDKLLTYYLSLPRHSEAGVPLRSAINPAGIKEILPHLHLSEWQPPDRLIVRLRGTALDGQFLDAREGDNMLDVVHVDDHAAYCHALGQVFSLPCGVLLERRIPDEYGKSLPFHMLALPLVDGEGRIRFMVGASSIEDVPMWSFQQTASFTVTEARLTATHFINIGFGTPGA